MIFDEQAQIAIDNLGWVDKGALWIYDLGRRSESRLHVAACRYMALSPGSNGLVRMVYQDAGVTVVSLRRVGEPQTELACCRIVDGQLNFSGDDTLWDQVNRIVFAGDSVARKLYKIEPQHQKLIDLDLSWFSAKNYDLGYQGLIDAVELDQIGRVIVSVQRSSKLIVIDPQENQVVGSIELAGRSGNPRLAIAGNHLLASDYDTLCRVDLPGLTMSTSKLLQPGVFPMDKNFIGDFSLDSDDSCIVARPFSGDVLRVSAGTFAPIAVAPIGDQPLSVCTVSPDTVLTRDWKTGAVGLGQFKPVA